MPVSFLPCSCPNFSNPTLGNDARYTLEAFIAMTVRARHLNDETARAAETARQEAEQESVVTNQRWCGQAEDTA